MKKILITGLVTMVVLGSFSCSKEKGAAASSSGTTSGAPSNHVLINDPPMSAGEWHNAILNDYWSHGSTTITGALTKNQVRNISHKFAVLFADAGGIDPEDIEEFNDNEMAYMINAGYFDANDLLKSPEQIIALQIAGISNSIIKAAYTSILDYSSNASVGDFINFDISTLNGLSGLTAAEQERIDDGISVLGSSYIVFQGRTNLENARFIFYADQIGMETGSMLGNYYYPGNTTAAGMYAAYFSAKCSAMAARIVANN
jgi:hypothetical protein